MITIEYINTYIEDTTNIIKFYKDYERFISNLLSGFDLNFKAELLAKVNKKIYPFNILYNTIVYWINDSNFISMVLNFSNLNKEGKFSNIILLEFCHNAANIIEVLLGELNISLNDPFEKYFDKYKELLIEDKL